MKVATVLSKGLLFRVNTLCSLVKHRLQVRESLEKLGVLLELTLDELAVAGHTIGVFG